MLKEKGYDEFLAEKVRQGLSDVEMQRGLSLEQSKERARKVIERKAQELATFDRENVYV
ncbi:hypothetical protein [Actinobacillus indolicus]|uniref:hypothetical protein n=1 Tax=Actinobacillus indolicus TaxID=51049 RepID=UPI0013C2DCFD|nr:hypothetical protein [Actinobacillus indolicus]